jgi:hypothetical protein
LSIDSSAGIISGTASVAGSYAVTVTAANQYAQSSSTSFTWMVSSPPLVSYPANQQTFLNGSVSLPITASDNGLPVTYTATGLPTGLSIDSSAGIISGTASVAGSYAVTVTATNQIGQLGYTNFNWVVSTSPIVVQTPTSQTSNLLAYSWYAIQAADLNGYPLTYSASGLPPGFSINTSTGAIGGYGTTVGSYMATITIADGIAAPVTVFLPWAIQ